MSTRVTKTALIARLVETGLTKRQAEQVYRSFFDEIGKSLANGDPVTFRGFGRFSTKFRPFHWCQIPRDSEIVRIPDRMLVRFTPGKHLRAAADASPDDPYFDAIIARRRRNSRQLLSQPERNPPVHDTQFDMGIAYREMGLFEQAIARFQAALALLDERERGARFVRCCYMLGLCHKDVGAFEIAEGWFQSGIEAPRRPLAERLEFHYQLGVLYGTEGRVREALTELRQVFIVNPKFRDVTEHIHTLKELQKSLSV